MPPVIDCASEWTAWEDADDEIILCNITAKPAIHNATVTYYRSMQSDSEYLEQVTAGSDGRYSLTIAPVSFFAYLLYVRWYIFLANSCIKGRYVGLVKFNVRKVCFEETARSLGWIVNYASSGLFIIRATLTEWTCFVKIFPYPALCVNFVLCFNLAGWILCNLSHPEGLQSRLQGI